MRRPFPDDRMPSEIPRKSLPSKAFVSQRRCASAKAASQPASQPASTRTPHEQAAEAKLCCVCTRAAGEFFYQKKRQKKIPKLNSNSNDAQYV
jgi:hypothetical protein